MRFLRFFSLLLAVVLVLSLTPVRANDLETERRVFEYLTGTMGLNPAAACGVMANIDAESGFSLGALGDSGTSYGLCQWHNSRYENLKSFCLQQNLDYRTLEGQMAYLNLELKTYYQSTYAVLRSVPNTPEGAFTAAYHWCFYFEAPADRENAAARRGRSAQMKYWVRYGAETAIDSLGVSGLGLGSSGSTTFYWETDDDPVSPVLPGYIPTVPTAPAKPQEEAPASDPEAQEPQETVPPRFQFVPHHRPAPSRQPSTAEAGAGSPWAMLFVAAGDPKKKYTLPQPEEVEEEAAL